MVQLGDIFDSMEAACEAVQRYVLDEGELYKTAYADKKRYIIICKDNKCDFRIRVSNSKKSSYTVTILKLHSCCPTTYYKNKTAHSVKYLIDHHCATILDNRYVTASQIRSSECLNYNNEISYKQVYCTFQGVLLV